MSSNTSTVPRSIELIAEGRSLCFEANVPMKYHPKQFLFAIGSPDFPAITCVSLKASAKSVQLTNQLFRPIYVIALKLISSGDSFLMSFSRLF